jgi:polar amino acid transport system substrate-binding protein
MRRKMFSVIAGCLMIFIFFAGMAFSSEVTPYAIFKGSTLNHVIQANILKVGMEVEYFPFEYADKKGNPIGFDVEIAKLIARELGVKLEINDIEWTGLIPSLQTGKVDLIISGMTRTLTRAKAVSFTDPYFVTGLCALMSKKRSPGLASVNALNRRGKIIAVKTGTTGDLIAKKRFAKAQINRFKDETACVREVVNGRADAFIYDQLSIAKHQKQNRKSTYALLKPFTYEPFSIAIRKGDYDFLGWLNLFLETLRRNGRYKVLYNRYFHDLIP